MTQTTAAPDSSTAPAVVPAPTTLEQVVNNSLWSLPIPIPQGEAEPADVKDYKELHTAKVALLKKRLANLPAVVDEKTYDVNQKALTALVKVRTGLNKARQGMFESVKKLKEDVDRYVGTTAESGLQAHIKALETPIEERMQEYRDAIEKKRQEAERVLEQRNNDRIAYILGADMHFDGQKYTLGELILWPVDLRNFGEPEWMGWIEKKLKPAVDAAKAAKEEEERAFAEAQAAKDQKDREMRALFEKQQADQKRMDEDRAELDRQMAELRKQKQELRAQELTTLGAEVHELGYYHVEEFCQVVSDLAGLNDEDWTLAKDAVRRSKVKVIERDQENARRWKLYGEREPLLRALPRHHYDGDSVWTLGEATATDLQLSTFTSDEWAACLQQFEAEQTRLDTTIAKVVPEFALPPGGPDFTKGINPPDPDLAPEPVAGTYAPLRPKPEPDPTEIRRLQGAVLELEAAMVSCGSSAEHTAIEAHRAFFLKAEASCRLLHGEVSLVLNTYRDGQDKG